MPARHRPDIAKAIEHHTRVKLRNADIWLEHGKTRHFLNKHGRDPRPVTTETLRHVSRLVNRADRFELGDRVHFGVVKSVVLSARDGQDRVHMVFDVPRRGLTLRTMYKTKDEVPPA